MTKEEVYALLSKAIADMLKHQPDIHKFTPETGQTEWNIAHHLASEISKLIPQYSHDLDVTKHAASEQRPDIIFHRRGTNEENFLVVELKTVGTSGSDINKIEEYWFAYPYSYKFGATIKLSRSREPLINVIESPGHSSSTRHTL